MPNVNLADTRTLTIEDAKETLRLLSEVSCKVEALKARRNLMIHRIKTETEQKVKDLQAAVPELKGRLTAYIMAHQDQFKNPRAIETDFGKFGMRKCGNKLEIEDEEAVIEYAMENGYEDLVVTTHKLQLDAVKRRIKDGDEIPGCSMPGGETAFYSISKALLESSKQSAGDD